MGGREVLALLDHHHLHLHKVVFFTWFCRFLVNPTQKSRSLYPSVEVTSTCASIFVCHFLIMAHCLSRVSSMPWKLVRHASPCTSSHTRRNLRYWDSSPWRSAWLTS